MKKLVLLSIFFVSIFANINAQSISQEEFYFQQPEEDFVNQNHVNDGVKDDSFSINTVENEDGLWLSYPFNNGSLENVAASGLHSLTIQGNITPTEDKFGVQDNAYLFDGWSYMETDDISFDFDEISISVWIHPTKNYAQHIFDTPKDNLCFGMYYESSIHMDYYVDENDTPESIQSNPIIKDQWTHITFTFDGYTSNLYINGALEGTKTSSKKQKLNILDNGKIFIGGTDNTNSFIGIMDDIRIYSRLLEESEVLDIYNTTKSIPSKILLHNPRNELIGLPLKMTFGWAKDGVSNLHHFQLSKSPDFTTNILDSTFDNCLLSITNNKLEYSTVYYWRVSGINELGQGEWSDTFVFTTEKEVSVYDQIDQIIKIAPNPFIDQINVSGKFEKIILYDIYGNILYEKEYSASIDRKISINSLKLAQGIYFIIIDGIATKLLKTN
jgi:concanavalin A-like lectin/glucanase superfamily protein/type IX secretion system substrate protein